MSVLQSQRQRWVWVILLAGLVVRSTIAGFLPPGFDEAYYYLYTQHLDWSYFDHPPLVALSTGLGVWLSGNVSAFTIRWGTLLLHTGALLLLYQAAAGLFGRKAALRTLAIASLVPIFLVGFGVLTLPDAPLMFFWSATLYTAAREFFPSTPDGAKSYQPSGKLAIVGLFVGLACLSKYHGAILGFGLLGFCLTSPFHRRALRSPWLLLAFALFLLAIAPILIWNGQHDWVSLRFQSGRAVPGSGYRVLDLLVTILVGIAYLFPSFGFPLWWTTIRTAKEAVRSGNGDDRLKQRLILWVSLPLVLGFTVMGGYRSILPTWTAPGFWGLTLLLGADAARWSVRWTRRWLWGSGWAIGILLLIALLHLNLGIFQQNSRYALGEGFVAAEADASVQQVDVSQLRQGFRESGVLNQGEFVFTNDIFLAGQVGMAIAPLTRQPVTVLSNDPRGFAFWSEPPDWVGKTGLLVTPAGRAEATVAQYQGYFKSIVKAAEIPVRRGGAIVQTFEVYCCQTLLRPYLAAPALLTP